jgi:hypothetical protein
MSNFKERSAYHRLNRLQWLKSNGCEFTFDVDTQIARIRQDAPGWKPEYGERAAEDPSSRLREVKRETDPTGLLSGPVRSVVHSAHVAEKRADGFISEHDPFSGLIESRPARALAALRKAEGSNEAVLGYWSRFLNAQGRIEDSTRMRILIAYSLDQLNPEHFDEISSSAADWFEKSGQALWDTEQQIFDRLWRKFIETVQSSDKANSSALLRQNDDIDWATEAVNSIAGDLAELHIKMLPDAPNKKQRKLPKNWTERALELLNLPSPSSQYVIVLLGHQLKYLYWYDNQWVDSHLLGILGGEGQEADIEALWAGFFWGARIPQVTLFRRLKPYLLRMASSGTPRRKRHGEILSGILLAGWHYKPRVKRLITTDELHKVILDADDEFRSHILWQIDRWSNGNQGWSADLIEFIDKVWPKQKKARNPRISERFVEIAISQAHQFDAVLRVALPLIGKIGRNSLALYKLRRDDANVLSEHPEQCLELLHACLPDDPADWPYDAQTIVRELANVAPELGGHPRMLELLGRMDGV